MGRLLRDEAMMHSECVEYSMCRKSLIGLDECMRTEEV